ncbi:hypothetical protein BJX66DRAFT_319326 [Aspergillus keveii]|uniref:SMP-30/Gluconolactonase/LRE-like region domain-containing protein n=1 Tax=Aspergillus keveii TaxID=714993 RepID=A0ABR4FID3_9EURO
MLRNKLLPSFLLSLLAPALAEANVNIRKLYQFPNDVFHDIENIAIRSNGHLLLNAITEPVVYTLDPRAATPTATPLHQFDGATGLAGITEVSPDVFALVVGNYSVHELKGIQGSFGIWKLDLTSGTPVVSKITSIPEGQPLNGMTTASENVVLVADSPVGIVYSVNINTGAYQVAIQDTQFQPPPGSPFPLGVNGIHRRDGTLYFTNSGLNTFGKLPITAQGTAAGVISIIASAPANNFYDDFALDAGGNPWITLHPHALEIVRLPSGSHSIALNSTEVVHPTSCIFGNSCDTKRTLYVVTAGEETESHIISGQVFAITV